LEAWLAGVDHALSPRDVTQHCAGEACVRVVRLFVATLPAPAR
jgi:hypothetical protein